MGNCIDVKVKNFLEAKHRIRDVDEHASAQNTSSLRAGGTNTNTSMQPLTTPSSMRVPDALPLTPGVQANVQQHGRAPPVQHMYPTVNLDSTSNVIDNQGMVMDTRKRSLSPVGDDTRLTSRSNLPHVPDDNQISMWAPGQSVLESNGVGRITLAKPDLHFDWNIRGVSNMWMRPETHRARVHVSEFGTDWGRKLANTVLHMRDILFDWNGVPHGVYLSQMHPFVEDGGRDALSETDCVSTS